MNWSSAESSATRMVLRAGMVSVFSTKRKAFQRFCPALPCALDKSWPSPRDRVILCGVMQPRAENPRALRVGIDLGGTKTEGIVLDPDGVEVWRKRIDTQAQEGYDAILGRIRSLYEDLIARVGN